jgi:hypothetical protein
MLVIRGQDQRKQATTVAALNWDRVGLLLISPARETHEPALGRPTPLCCQLEFQPV